MQMTEDIYFVKDHLPMNKSFSPKDPKEQNTGIYMFSKRTHSHYHLYQLQIDIPYIYYMIVVVRWMLLPAYLPICLLNPILDDTLVINKSAGPEDTHCYSNPYRNNNSTT